MDALSVGHPASKVHWRPSVFLEGDKRIKADHRRGMLFSPLVPVILMIAWVVLASIVLLAR